LKKLDPKTSKRAEEMETGHFVVMEWTTKPLCWSRASGEAGKAGERRKNPPPRAAKVSEETKTTSEEAGKAGGRRKNPPPRAAKGKGRRRINPPPQATKNAWFSFRRENRAFSPHTPSNYHLIDNVSPNFQL
jgi:hypothetical protein